MRGRVKIGVISLIENDDDDDTDDVIGVCCMVVWIVDGCVEGVSITIDVALFVSAVEVPEIKFLKRVG